MPEPRVRLHKFIADCGLASRRAAEKLIGQGLVKVNGQVITELGTKIDPQKDRVEVRGQRCAGKEGRIYLKLYKPRGYISSCRSEKGERTVLDLVKGVKERLYPVGRLDMASEGLMILTNDGEMANRLMHPRYEHEKEYEVNVEGPITKEQLSELESGIELEEGKTLPAKIIKKDNVRFNVILKEGKKRQIRRMVEVIGNKVTRLKRIRIKNILLGDLRPGEHKPLTPSELHSLQS